MRNIGELIRELRKSKKMKQKDLAKLIGVSERTLFNYEEGRTIPTVEKVLYISKVLDIPKEFFFNTSKSKEIFDDIDNVDNKDFPSDYHTPVLDKKILESVFENYINNLIINSDKTHLKNIQFTSDDYKALSKCCNNIVLNICESYLKH